MNNTNRGLNRAMLLIVGLVLTVAGAAVILARVWPQMGDAWTTGFTTSIEALQKANEQTRLPGSTDLTWLGIGIAAVLIVVIILMIAALARLGGGAGTTVLRSDSDGSPRDAIVIEQGFAADALVQTLERREEILSARVRARKIQGTNVMHVTVTPRKNTSPAEVATTVGTLLENLEILVGNDLPALVSIKSGIRTRLASDQSRVV